jgi:hypothetical protein
MSALVAGAAVKLTRVPMVDSNCVAGVANKTASCVMVRCVNVPSRRQHRTQQQHDRG